jgi:hypothetical protein
MLCNACSKLAFLNASRVCMRCKGSILNNLSVVCDNCSTLEKLCSVCLKKLQDPAIKQRSRSNCSSCGK